MGKCCGKPEQPDAKQPETQYFYITCEGTRQECVYRAESSLAVCLNRLPHYSSDHVVYKGKYELTDVSLTLKALTIQPGDSLLLVPPPAQETLPPRRVPSIVANSLEDIAEEESTHKHPVGSMLPKQPGRMHADRPDKTASSLWRTALMGPRQVPLPEAADSSATSVFAQDFSFREKAVPVHLPLGFQPPAVSGVFDSDESNSQLSRGPNNRHPSDYFQDIQGPFSILKQL